MQIAPWAICTDDSKPESKCEVNYLMERMSDYLREHGEWLEKPKRNRGRLINWMPKQKHAALAL